MIPFGSLGGFQVMFNCEASAVCFTWMLVGGPGTGRRKKTMFYYYS